MDRATVFDDLKRSDARGARHSEDAFTFLNRVAGPFWDRTRATLEVWFSRFPSDGRADVRARLRSCDDRQFSGAFWELYLHEALRREGFRLTPHPHVPGTSSRPDFLVEGGQEAFYLEATVTGGPASETAAERRRNTVYDSLDQLDSPNFFLWAQVYEDGPASPSGGKLRHELAQWLARLEPDEVAALYEASGRQALPKHEWVTEGWRIVFTALPKKEEARGKPGVKPLGAWGPGRAFYVNDVGQVRRDLEDKSGRYGSPHLPFIIAVSVDSSFYDHYAMSGALFGQEAVQFDTLSEETRRIRQPDGLWRGPQGARNTRVAAVVAARHVRPWNVTESEPVTWHNPWAAHPLPHVLPWESFVVNLTHDTFERTEAKRRAHEVLGLPEGWPGPEDALVAQESESE